MKHGITLHSTMGYASPDFKGFMAAYNCETDFKQN